MMSDNSITWLSLLNTLFYEFNTKSGAVGEIEIYKADDLDYVENSARIAQALIESDEISLPEEIHQKFEDEWTTVEEVFDYIHEQAPKDLGLSTATVLSYDTTGFTGSSTTYSLFTYDNRALFWESADAFTSGMYVISPITQSTDLTKLVLTYFLGEGLPNVDIFSIKLNPNWIDQQVFKEGVVDRLMNILDEELKSRHLINKMKKTLESSTEEKLTGILGSTEFGRLRKSLKSNKLNREVLSVYVNALLNQDEN